MRHGPPKVHILLAAFALCTATALGQCSGRDCTIPPDDGVSLLQVSTFDVKRRTDKEISEASLMAEVESMATIDSIYTDADKQEANTGIESRMDKTISEASLMAEIESMATIDSIYTDAEKQEASMLSETVMGAVIPGMFSIMVLLFAGISGIIGIVVCANMRLFPPRKGRAPEPLPPSPKMEPSPEPSAEQVPEMPVPLAPEDDDPVEELCEGSGFLVPKGQVYHLMVPALPVKPDALYDFHIATQSGTIYSLGQYVDMKGDPFSGVKKKESYEEYITMTSPPGHEEGREHCTMVVGRPPDRSNVEAHILYGPGYGGEEAGFGIVRRTTDPKMRYEVVGKQPLYISTNDGEGGNRTVRVFNANLKERASATCYITGQGRAWYDVHCFGNCDMLYISLAIMGVDRISSKELVELDTKLWK